MMPKPTLGQANLAALIGMVIGSILGLFALGLVPAIITRQPGFLAIAPKLNIISFFICGGVGWVLGGQIGPRIYHLFGPKNAHIIGGVIGGLAPVIAVAAIGWYLATQPA
jgi:hypothetical protein